MPDVFLLATFCFHSIFQVSHARMAVIGIDALSSSGSLQYPAFGFRARLLQLPQS